MMVMKIDFNDQGTVSTVTVTSSVFEFRRHNRVIDVALFLTPEITSQSSGFFIIKQFCPDAQSTHYGPTNI